MTDNFIKVNGVDGANAIDMGIWKLISHNPATDEFTFALRAKQVKPLDTGHPSKEIERLVNDLQDIQLQVQGLQVYIEKEFGVKAREL